MLFSFAHLAFTTKYSVGWQSRAGSTGRCCPAGPDPCATLILTQSLPPPQPPPPFTKLIHISGSDIFKIFKNPFLVFLAQERALGPQNSKSAGRNLPGVLSRALEVGIGPIFAPITVADGMGSTVWINLVNPVNKANPLTGGGRGPPPPGGAGRI